MKWNIVARNSAGMIMYFCSSPTREERMLGNAMSMSKGFETIKEAKVKIKKLKKEWKGLKEWQLSERCEDISKNVVFF